LKKHGTSRNPDQNREPAAKARKQTGSAQAAGAAPKVKGSRPGVGAKPPSHPRSRGDIGLSCQVSKGEIARADRKAGKVNTKLRAKNREAGEKRKLSANRIAELEKQVASLRDAEAKAAPVESPEKLSKTKTSKQRASKSSPGAACHLAPAMQRTHHLIETQRQRAKLKQHLMVSKRVSTNEDSSGKDIVPQILAVSCRAGVDVFKVFSICPIQKNRWDRYPKWWRLSWRRLI